MTLLTAAIENALDIIAMRENGVTFDLSFTTICLFNQDIQLYEEQHWDRRGNLPLQDEVK